MVNGERIFLGRKDVQDNSCGRKVVAVSVFIKQDRKEKIKQINREVLKMNLGVKILIILF